MAARDKDHVPDASARASAQLFATRAKPYQCSTGTLQLFGAGREKRIYAIPSYTRVVSLDFGDHPFERTKFDAHCEFCGATESFLDEVVTDDAGGRMIVCSDTDYCEKRLAAKKEAAE